MSEHQHDWKFSHQSEGRYVFACAKCDMLKFGKPEGAPSADVGAGEAARETCAECGFPVTQVRPGKWQCDYCEACVLVGKQEGEIATLTATNQRLRGALEKIDKIACHHKRGAIVEAQHVARSALAGDGSEGAK